METHTHWKKNFDYRFTGAYELEPNQEKIVTITKVGIEQVKSTDGNNQDCLVAYFKEDSKPMVLNKTNCKTIEKLYSPYTEDWIGKKITVFSTKVRAFGETVDALRIRPTKPKTKSLFEFESDLKACKNLDELKRVFSSPEFPRSQLTKLKDELKTKLS